MTTHPPAGPSTSGLEPHEARQVAESFGVDAERYDRTRPRYPDAMVAAIVATSPGPSFLDVGIGTGIAARQFQQAGCTVLGVEPDERMADFARRTGIEVEVSTFEAWDPRDRRFDAVVAGQAWHWVDPIAGAARAAAVLRPGGRLAVFWNASEPPRALSEAFGEVYRRVLPDSPIAAQPATSAAQGYTSLGEKATDGLRQAGGFGELEQWQFTWRQSYTRDEWLAQLPTSGLLTRLPADVLEQLLTGIGAAIDAVGGSFVNHFTTVVTTAVREGGE